jgi:hypothetical protein
MTTTESYDDLMSQTALENVFKEMFAAIDVCLTSQIKLPVLMLAYTLIDIAGWLNGDEELVKVRFTDWVEKYILPNSTLPCTALELYGARCGLLHNYSATSNLSSTGQVRRIFYAWRPSRVDDLANLISLDVELKANLGKDAEQIVAVQAEDFLSALQTGVDRFLSDIAKDPQRAARVSNKAEEMMAEHQDADLKAWIAAARGVLRRTE